LVPVGDWLASFPARRDRSYRKRRYSQFGVAVDASGIAGLGFVLRPRDDIGQRHIMIQLDVGGSDNGLVRLSASGGTEMMGCSECSGSPFRDIGLRSPPVSSGGRYSDGA